VNVELEAPPPSPSVYMDMGSVSPGHYLQLQDQQEEEEESVVFMDAVSTPSIPSVFTLALSIPIEAAAVSQL